MRWIGLLLFGIGGLAVFVAGIQLGLARYQLFLNGVHAKGKVVATDVVTRKEGMFDYQSRPGRFHTPETVTTTYPVVEFQTKSGETVRFRGAVANVDIPVDTFLDVYYDPRNPSGAQIGTFFQLFSVALTMIAAGPILVAIGIMGFLSKD